MTWIQTNFQASVIATIAVAWLAQMLGPSAARLARNGVATLWPHVRPKLTLKNLILPMLAVLVAATRLIPTPEVVAPARAPDTLDRCIATGRALLADELEAIASQKFADLQAKEDAINTKIHDVVESAFEPLNQQIAKAALANRLADYAKKIRAGEADEQ